MNDHQMSNMHQPQNAMPMQFAEPQQYYMNPTPMPPAYDQAPRFLPPPPPAEDHYYPPPPPYARPVEKVAPTSQPNVHNLPPPPPPPSNEPAAEEQHEEPSSSFNPIMKLNIAAAIKKATNIGSK